METLVWKGKPSQWLNFLWYVFVLLGIIFVPNSHAKGLFLLFGVYRYLVIYCISYEITTERIIMRRGVFSRITQNLEIFRVKDIRLDEPFLLRILNLSSIFLITSDQTNRFVRLKAINAGEFLREKIRQLSEERREIKDIKEIDVSHLYL